ncbi:MAG TPA: GNAT family N-acetyltransferase [Anaerolineae bacterium]|nr:GNAT family N-acetyltransferase [Anaerolineae bacterium]
MASTIFPINTRSATSIRPINLARDMARVMYLLNRVFSPTLDAEGRRALNSMSNQPAFILQLHRLSKRIAPGFIYELNGEIVGNISIIPTLRKNRVIIANVAVHEDFRRRGIARMMLEATLEYLDNLDINTVMLQVDVENKGARQLYLDFGFKAVGSTTLWIAAPHSWHDLNVPQSAEIRPLRSSENQAAFELDRATFPRDLCWPEPIEHNVYHSNWWKWIDNFLNGKSAESWVAADEDGLHGVATIWSEWGQPHRLTVRVDPDQHEDVLPPLVAKLLRRLKYLRRRHVSIEHPLDDALMSELLLAANFYAKRNLTTMRRG